MKKSTIFITILIIIFLSLSAYGGYYLYKEGYLDLEKENPESEPELTFFLKPINQKTQQLIDLDYLLFEGNPYPICLTRTSHNLFLENETNFFAEFPELKNKVIDEEGCYIERIDYFKVKEGHLVKSLNEININPEKLYLLYFSGDNYYTENHILLPINIGYEEVKKYAKEDNVFRLTQIKNKSIHLLEADKQEDNLSIEMWGELLNNTLNPIRFSIKGEDELRDLTICFDWSFSIMNIYSDLKETDKPSHLDFPNKCFYSGENLDKQLTFDFNVSTAEQYGDDFIKVYIIDKDQYFGGSEWNYATEKDSENIGAKDFEKVFEW